MTTTDCYRRTRQFIQTVLPKMGIRASVIDPSDLATLKSILDSEKVCCSPPSHFFLPACPPLLRAQSGSLLSNV